MTLTKRHIARRIQESCPGLEARQASELADTVIAVLRERFATGERVMITNFGTFEVVTRAARRGVNPATGESIEIPTRQTLVFHAAAALTEAVDD